MKVEELIKKEYWCISDEDKEKELSRLDTELTQVLNLYGMGEDKDNAVFAHLLYFINLRKAILLNSKNK